MRKFTDYDRTNPKVREAMIETRVHNVAANYGTTLAGLNRMSDQQLLGLNNFGEACRHWLRVNFVAAPKDSAPFDYPFRDWVNRIATASPLRDDNPYDDCF